MAVHAQMVLSYGGSAAYGRQLGQFSGCPKAPDVASWRCRGSGGLTCNIQPCIQTFVGNITGGNLTETMVSANMNMSTITIEYPDLESSKSFQTSVKAQCLTNDTRQSVSNVLGYSLENIEWLDIPVAVNPRSQYVVGPADNKTYGTLAEHIDSACVYQMSQSTIIGVIDYLANYLNGTVELKDTT